MLNMQSVNIFSLDNRLDHLRYQKIFRPIYSQNELKLIRHNKLSSVCRMLGNQTEMGNL